MNKKANSRMRLEGGGKGIATEGLDLGVRKRLEGDFQGEPWGRRPLEI